MEAEELSSNFVVAVEELGVSGLWAYVSKVSNARALHAIACYRSALHHAVRRPPPGVITAALSDSIITADQLAALLAAIAGAVLNRPLLAVNSFLGC